MIEVEYSKHPKLRKTILKHVFNSDNIFQFLLKYDGHYDNIFKRHLTKFLYKNYQSFPEMDAQLQIKLNIMIRILHIKTKDIPYIKYIIPGTLKLALDAAGDTNSLFIMFPNIYKIKNGTVKKIEKSIDDVFKYYERKLAQLTLKLPKYMQDELVQFQNWEPMISRLNKFIPTKVISTYIPDIYYFKHINCPYNCAII